MFQSIYKVVKSAWGIYIKLSGELSLINEDYTNSFLKVSNNMYVKINITLNEREFLYFCKGIEYASKHIKELENNTYYMKINIHIVETDYQEEGIYAATIKWLMDYFDKEYESIDVHFDKLNNKYVYPTLLLIK